MCLKSIMLWVLCLMGKCHVPNAKAIIPKIGNQMTDAPNVGENWRIKV
jgi:hypothetical protein